MSEKPMRPWGHSREYKIDMPTGETPHNLLVILIRYSPTSQSKKKINGGFEDCSTLDHLP